MTDREIDEAIAFIKRNLKTEFSLADIADHIGYSPFHLAREFRTQTGMSVMLYARKLKLHEASKEIVKGRGIFDVALDYGFDTHAGFTKAFISKPVEASDDRGSTSIITGPQLMLLHALCDRLGKSEEDKEALSKLSKPAASALITMLKYEAYRKQA